VRRAVVTGLGIVSCLGNEKQQVTEALKTGRSGISGKPEYAEAGMRSQIAGSPVIDFKDHIDRKQLRFMGASAAYAYISMQQAVEDSGLTESMVSNVRTGIIAGSGGASSANQVEAADVMRDKGVRRVGPYRVTQTMGSTVSACLATPFSIKGVNYSMSSACSTSAHCIGHAVEQIQLGKQDVVFAGGGEEEHWTMSCLFDAMGALSSVVAVCWLLKSSNMHWHAVPKSMRKLLAMVRHLMVLIWLHLLAKEQCAVCKWQCSHLMAGSIQTSII